MPHNLDSLFTDLEALLSKHNLSSEQLIDAIRLWPKDFLRERINDLNFSARVINICSEVSIITVADLASKSEAELLRLDNFGSRSLREVKKFLAERGLSLQRSRNHYEPAMRRVRDTWEAFEEQHHDILVTLPPEEHYNYWIQNR